MVLFLKNHIHLYQSYKIYNMKETIIRSNILLACILFSNIGFSQTKLGNNLNSINSNALLEMETTNKGLLLPRVALTATNSALPLTAFVEGMIIYNTATAGISPNDVTPGYYYCDGTMWTLVQSAITGIDYDWSKSGNKIPSAIADTTSTIYHKAPVSIGINTINNSALLEIQSSNKGFLPPRMTNSQMKAIAAPIAGMLIYNLTLGCLCYYIDSSYNCSHNMPILSAPSAPLGSSYTTHFNGWSGGTYSVGGASSTTVTHTAGETFSSNTNCTSAKISAQGCGGATTVTGSSGTVYNLVNINGQCWTTSNMKEIPSNFKKWSFNSWLNTNPGDSGYWGFYNSTTTSGASGWGLTELASGEGYLYQWSAAMDNSIKERSRGVCPIGFHIPSDCEFMYLEHGLGMSLTCQLSTASRCTSAGQGDTYSKLFSNGNNVTLWNGKLNGQRSSAVFSSRGTTGTFQSSTKSGNSVYPRRVTSLYSDRQPMNISMAFGVRCLRD